MKTTEKEKSSYSIPGSPIHAPASVVAPTDAMTSEVRQEISDCTVASSSLECTTKQKLRRQQKDQLETSQVAAGATTKKSVWAGISWPIAAWIGIIHLGALAAPWTFSWYGLGVMLFLYWLTGGVGICLGYHRCLSHKSFQTYPAVRWLLAWIGGLAGEGSAIHWVANHRTHHACSDHDGDPHSPRKGFLWSHVLWCLQGQSSKELHDLHQRWAPDMARDPVMRFLDRTFLHWQIAVAVGLGAIGYAIGGISLAASFVVWGVFVRMVVVLHATWCINSVTHVWGYKTYDNGDDSKNLWWVALVTFGEGWHNNHHAYQRAANYGHRWWEIDTTYWMITLMRRVGLAWSVAPIPQKALEALERKRIDRKQTSN